MNTPLTRNQFLTGLERNGISLDESRMAEVNYYFNLWDDTMMMNRKCGQVYNFVAFCNWMKKQ